MLPWQLSSWSTNDAIRAVGLKRSQFGSNVFAANQYLYAHGHIARLPGVLTFGEEALTESALERSK
jgi:hypothetical protein